MFVLSVQWYKNGRNMRGWVLGTGLLGMDYLVSLVQNIWSVLVTVCVSLRIYLKGRTFRNKKFLLNLILHMRGSKLSEITNFDMFRKIWFNLRGTKFVKISSTEISFAKICLLKVSTLTRFYWIFYRLTVSHERWYMWHESSLSQT